MSSLPKTASRQCASRVPGPPTLASGTRARRGAAATASRTRASRSAPVNVGLTVPAPWRSPSSSQFVPKPSTWPISWVMTLTRLPSASIVARSAVSKYMTPGGRAGSCRGAAGSGRPGRGSRRGPSIAAPSASMTMSSTVSPSTITDGTSAVMIRDQRVAAVVNAACWALVRPPLKRTSMTNAGSCSAAVSSCRPQLRIAPASWNAPSSTSSVQLPSAWQPWRSARSPCGRKRPANGGTASAIATGATASKTVSRNVIGAPAAAARQHDARAVGRAQAQREVAAPRVVEVDAHRQVGDRALADAADGDRRGRRPRAAPPAIGTGSVLANS